MKRRKAGKGLGRVEIGVGQHGEDGDGHGVAVERMVNVGVASRAIQNRAHGNKQGQFLYCIFVGFLVGCGRGITGFYCGSPGIVPGCFRCDRGCSAGCWGIPAVGGVGGSRALVKREPGEVVEVTGGIGKLWEKRGSSRCRRVS